MGELLDQDGRQALVLLLVGVCQLLAIAIADGKTIMQLATFQIDARLGDVYVPHRQRIGKSIEKSRRVVGAVEVRETCGRAPIRRHTTLSGGVDGERLRALPEHEPAQLR